MQKIRQKICAETRDYLRLYKNLYKMYRYTRYLYMYQILETSESDFLIKFARLFCTNCNMGSSDHKDLCRYD